MKFVDGKDLALLAGLPLLTALSWCLPERVWCQARRKLAFAGKGAGQVIVEQKVVPQKTPSAAI